jgi:hypothetical protein
MSHTARRRQKKCRRLARKKSENLSREGEKRARLVGKRMDALSLCSDTLMLTKHLFFFFFFCRGTTFSLKTPLSSPQKSKNTSTTSTRNNKKNYGRFESQRYARDARDATRAVDVLDREMRSIAHRPRSSSRNFFHRDLERGNFSENEFDQISLSLSFVFRRISFCVVPVFEFRRARARFYTATLTHSRVFFLS